MKSKNWVLLCVLFLMASACRKDKDNHVRENLLGKWKATENGRDDNANGKLDDGESFPDIVYVGNDVVFDADGTLTLVNSTSLRGRKTWELLHGDSYLRITEPAYATDYHIDAITSSSLTLKDTSNGRISWYMFSKAK